MCCESTRLNKSGSDWLKQSSKSSFYWKMRLSFFHAVQNHKVRWENKAKQNKACFLDNVFAKNIKIGSFLSKSQQVKKCEISQDIKCTNNRHSTQGGRVVGGAYLTKQRILAAFSCETRGIPPTCQVILHDVILLTSLGSLRRLWLAASSCDVTAYS